MTYMISLQDQDGAGLWQSRTATSHTGAQVCVLAALFPIQFPTNALGKAADDDPRTWVPAIYMGDLDRLPGSWL